MILLNATASITAPVKTVKSLTSPTFSWSRIFSKPSLIWKRWEDKYWEIVWSFRNENECLRNWKYSYVRPQRLWAIHSTASRTLLSIEFEGTFNCTNYDAVGISTRMDKVKVFAAAFADQLWIILVLVDIFANLTPETIEGRYWAGKINTG